MNTLQAALDEYLSVRRTLGFKLRDEGTVLPQFLCFLEEKGSPFITTDLALQWATQPENVLQAHWARRLAMVRIFAQFRGAVDPGMKFHPKAYFLTDIVAKRHTSMMMPKSQGLSKPQAIFHQQPGCVPQHIARCLGCFLLPVCE